ncbi:hypothetical protein [Nitrosopumilus adriaticus]|uniref:ATPase domain-containing protein n=1 Tax=Nitrosopumilus adriaticus TaxID=1580092 RepID=A0A0D5C3C7_9ARCH|nr:hypothetical protein [Nitrosopumilus adriaticus]AJW71063.1 hypothetical protein NADRNF5_1377 [Nitrosopumilus adriaticus]
METNTIILYQYILSTIDMSYSKFNLTSNPFLEEKHTFPMVGRKKDWDKIKNVTEELLTADSCGIITIYGDYGMGKTFTLLKMQEEYQKNKDSGKVIFLKTIETGIPTNFLSDLLIRITRNIGKDEMVKLAKRVDFVSLDIDNTLKNVLINLSDGNEISWKWFIGRSITNTELKQIQAEFKIKDNYETFTVFLDFLKFLYVAGCQNMILLFDEWEYLLSRASIDQVRTIVRDLQKLWDGYNECRASNMKLCKIIFVIASSIGSWRIFLEMIDKDVSKKGGGGTETFMRRIPEMAKINLSPFALSDVKKFIINRLKEYRLKPSSDDLFPLTNDYVQFITEISWGIPSSILSKSALIIKEASDGEIKQVTTDFSKQILKNHGILRELEEVGPIAE